MAESKGYKPFPMAKAPRQITPELQSFIDKRSSPYSVPFLFYLDVAGMMFPILLGVFLTWQFASVGIVDLSAPFSSVSLLIILSVFSIWTIGAITFFVMRMYSWGKNKERYERITREGRIVKGKVIDIQESWNIRLNGWPQRIIRINMNGQEIVHKTFDADVVKEAQNTGYVRFLQNPQNHSDRIAVAELRPKGMVQIQNVNGSRVATE